jgi:hypothetical protein
MTFEPGDIVALLRDDRQMVVISKLDARLVWLRLKDSDRDDMYAFRAADLRLIMRAQIVTDPVAFSTVPQIPRPVEVIAA